ncbi:hypothetical protein MTO96_045517 [Rhipicephalus appendiculatus]
MAFTPGPFRSASKLGAFITMVIFADIYKLHESVGDDKKEVFRRLKNVGVGGYRFDFDCSLKRDEAGQVQTVFGLFLVSGEWDDHLEWPFAKNVTVILTHISDHTKDIKLPIRLTWNNSTMKPAPGKGNPTGGFSRRLSWQEVELNGFIVNKAFCDQNASTPSYNLATSQVNKTNIMAFTPGPFRPASQLGAFITMVTLTDIYGLHDSLQDDKKEVFKQLENLCLGGYTFIFECWLTQGEGQVEMFFRLFLASGEWDDHLEWPFSKNVTVIVTHLRDQKKDVRLPIPTDLHDVHKKPTPGQPNRSYPSKKISWQQVVLNGFIANKNLYVNIEFA